MNLPWLDDARRQFSQQLLAGRQPHAVLISGPAGLGKLQLAQEMAVALLCLNPSAEVGNGTGMACGQCRSCTLFAGGAHPDFRFVSFIPKDRSEELRTVIVIDQVRELISSMQLTNGLSPRKVALIHPAEAMNRNAANAILKTLEEPVGEVVLLLVSNDASRLSATIRSRCQSLQLRPPAATEALHWLQQRAGVSRDEAVLALQAAASSPLQAVLLLQQGRVDEFRQVLESLQQISRDVEAVAPAYDQLIKLDPNELWNWLAIASAEKMRSCYGVDHGAGKNGSAGKVSARAVRQYADLHRLANRNRRLLSTALRKDLLLRDWLIQWASPTSS
ncbi:MAG: DNA polymerase III subunit delta' [Xanthomonadales bacterium]|nr:DNA polymerase III subunit delta' [Xanthomonadales bacterium]